MSVTTQATLFPHLQTGFLAAQTPHPQGASRSFATDPSVSSETIVYVVSNDAAQVRSLREFFSSHAMRVRTFKSATEYIRDAKPDRTACVILDLNLPDISGLDVQCRLVDSGGPPVIFVTAHGDTVSGVRAMKNGAIDFMIEPLDYNRLLAAVETAFAQDRRNRHERVERSTLLRRWNSLTPREQEVFQFTVAGFLNKQAAAELGIAENTFQVHRGRVMIKMEADSLADLVRMSTRLEFLVHSQGKNETTSQSLKTVLKGQIEGNSRGSRALTQTRHPCTNRISTPAFGRIGVLRYAKSR
jgi:FixJ family two-component response regulator